MSIKQRTESPKNLGRKRKIPADQPLVMHVIPGLGFGGAERMLSNLVTTQRDTAPRQMVVDLMRGGPFSAPIDAAGVPLYHLGAGSAGGMVTALLRLRRLIRQHRPDVIQSWMYYADLVTTTALRLSGQRQTTRHYWGVRCSDMQLDRYGRKLRWAVHRCVAQSHLPDAVIYNSAAGRQAHEALGYRPAKAGVIRNGIDPDRFKPSAIARQKVRASLGLSDQVPIAIMAARVDPKKNYPMLSALAACLPDVVFLAAGSGTEHLAGPDNMRGLGPRSDMPDLYAAADLTILTSAFGEGFPNVLAEAMACGIPAVATDVGDAAAIIGDTGFCLAVDDESGMARGIQKILAATPGQREEWSSRARQRVVDHFTLKQAVTAFDHLHCGGVLPARLAGD